MRGLLAALLLACLADAKSGCSPALKHCASCDDAGATCTACANGFAMYQGNCYRKCKQAGHVLVPINSAFYLKAVCIPASVLGCRTPAAAKDFSGCSACPAGQCQGRLKYEDAYNAPAAKAALKDYDPSYDDVAFDSAPVACTAKCPGCATVAPWSGGSACASCKPNTVPVPHPQAAGLFECLDSVDDDLNCAKGSFKPGVGCTKCEAEYFNPGVNVTMERAAVAGTISLPLASCASCEGNFNCKQCTKDGCANCDAPSLSNEKIGSYSEGTNPVMCHSCYAFGNCGSCTAEGGCTPGACLPGSREATTGNFTTCIEGWAARCHLTEFTSPTGVDPKACSYGLKALGCSAEKCKGGTGCTACPKGKTPVKTCPGLQACVPRKSLGCAPGALEAGSGCSKCPANSARMGLLSSGGDAYACVSCKDLGCPGNCEDGVGCTSCPAENSYRYREPLKLAKGKRAAQVLPWACGDCQKDLGCVEGACTKSSGCTKCPADHFLAASTSKCVGASLWGTTYAQSNSPCGGGDALTECRPCAERGCAPGHCDAKGACSKCAPGWVPKAVDQFRAQGGCIKITELNCDESTFSMAKPGCIACPKSTFPPAPPRDWSAPYFFCYTDGDE